MTGLTLGKESALLGFDFSPYVRFGRVAAELGGQSSWAGQRWDRPRLLALALAGCGTLGTPCISSLGFSISHV